MPRYVTGAGSAPRVSLAMRGVVLGLRWHGRMSFKAIGERLNMSKRTASEIVKRAKVN